MEAWSCPAEASAVHREICERVGTWGRVRSKSFEGFPAYPGCATRWPRLLRKSR